MEQEIKRFVVAGKRFMPNGKIAIPFPTSLNPTKRLISYIRFMILYNVTLILEEAIENEWLKWMQEEHIPEVMASQCFISNRMLRVLDSPNEGVTYCIQYIAETPEQYETYKNEFAPGLQAKTLAKFENRFVAYRTLMEFVDA